jgi:hypothetical protein
MISKIQEYDWLRRIWKNNIFIIPNDLYYFQDNDDWKEKENNLSKINNNLIIKEIIDDKIIFTNLLTPNWKKHINNYVRHKFSGYRKKIRKISQLNGIKYKNN